MGIELNINYENFPKQGSFLGKRIKVYFNYNTEKTMEGIVVRDDTEHPYRTIIKLDNNTYILSTECQFSLD